MYDLIIIGAGPAGCTAGIYAARQNLNVLMLSKELGGQVAKKAVDIWNYPGYDKISGPDLIGKFGDQLKANNIEVNYDEVVKIEKKDNVFTVTTANENKHESVAVIVATGADPRFLEAPGEKEYIGKGVSYCALCDGPMFKNKVVAVVGGGNSAFETALFLSNYVSKIYILEGKEEVNANLENQKLLEKTGKAEVITMAKVLKIEGDDFVKSLIYQNTETNEEVKLNLEGVFIEIGYVPSTAIVKNLVDFSDRDEIISDLDTLETKTPGLFTAGDCNKGKYKQIIIAAGEGASAANSATEYIKKNK